MAILGISQNYNVSVWTFGGGTLRPTSSPGSPYGGMVYYDSSAQKLRAYNETSWETVTSA